MWSLGKALDQLTETELPADTSDIKEFHNPIASDWKGELRIWAIQRQVAVKSQHAFWISALKT